MQVKGVNGTVILDSGFVTIARTGFLARATIGKGEKRLPLHQITAVQFKPAGLVNGFISFTIGGGIERQSRFGSQSIDATKDENSVLFTKKQQPDFERLRDAVEAGMARGQQPAAAAPDVVDQLRRLGDLRASGVLSPDEFERTKANLLNGMR